MVRRGIPVFSAFTPVVTSFGTKEFGTAVIEGAHVRRGKIKKLHVVCHTPSFRASGEIRYDCFQDQFTRFTRTLRIRAAAFAAGARCLESVEGEDL
jgi:hypothetical protein